MYEAPFIFETIFIIFEFFYAVEITNSFMKKYLTSKIKFVNFERVFLFGEWFKFLQYIFFDNYNSA